MSLTPNNEISAKSTTDVPKYSEFLDIYLGKRNAVMVSYAQVGGSIEFPLNFSWSEMENLVLLRFSVGVGYRWWLWYHRDIWPDIPPGVALTLVYHEDPETAVPKAKDLAARISSIYGIPLQPLHRYSESGYTIVRFFVAISTSDAEDLATNNIFPLIISDGLGFVKNSPKILDDIENERYFRSFYALIRDRNDFDYDNDTTEFVPIVGLAFVSKGAIEKIANATFRVSLDNVLGLDEEYTYWTDSDNSIVKFNFLFPIEVYEDQSILPDNTMYEYSGILAYMLKRGNYTRGDLPLDDIYITFGPFTVREEISQIPKVDAGFFITGVNTSSQINGENATEIEFTLLVINKAGSEAIDIKVFFPLPPSLLFILKRLQKEGYDVNETLVSDDWDIHENVSIGGYKGIVLNATLGNLNVNDSVNITFKLLIPNKFIGLLRNVPINVIYGPLVIFKDIEGKFYSVTANGFFVWITHTVVVARLNFNDIIAYSDKTTTVTLNVTIWNKGPDAISNIRVEIYRGVMTGYGEFSDAGMVAMTTIASISADSTKTVTLSFDTKLRPGFWIIFGLIRFEVDGHKFALTTNSKGVLILPPLNLLKRWLRRFGNPLPHVELDIFKNVTVEDGLLSVEIYITNIGELETTLTIIDWWNLDYIDTSKGINGVTQFEVNGSALDFDTNVDTLLGVLRVKSVATTVGVNSTIVIRFKLALKSGVNTSEIVVNPAVIKYLYSTFPPESAERPDEMEESEEGGALTLNDESYKLLSFTLKPMQGEEGSYLDTYTNYLLQVYQPSEEGEEGGIGGRGLLLIGAIVAIIVVGALVIVLRRR